MGELLSSRDEEEKCLVKDLFCPEVRREEVEPERLPREFLARGGVPVGFFCCRVEESSSDDMEDSRREEDREEMEASLGVVLER